MRKLALVLLLAASCGRHVRLEPTTGGVPRTQFVPVYYAERDGAPDRNGNFGFANAGPYDPRAWRYGGVRETSGYRYSGGYSRSFGHGLSGYRGHGR